MDKAEIDEIIEKIIDYSKNIEEDLAAPEVWEELKDPFKVLISVIISIRTREEVTIKAVRDFFKKFKDIEDIKKASMGEIANSLKMVGLNNQKARWIKEIAEKWDYKKICDEEFLQKLPGVGRKVRNVYLIIVCNRDYIAVDSNVHRIVNRIGIVNTKRFEETERALYNIIDKKYWRELNFNFVKFGRKICKPINPRCDICIIKNKCLYYKNKEK
ncbi:endonuclease III [Nanoarchaeota archaeon NZ13-N]|uniref:HhH-GPD domain-containing protein n=1 Tax=Candidatus Nanoclepta minutus TaxID=1940235 RepID=A0A397WP45_9ARCH|nr:MAG: endonuclease III [Nanoarchaeota archaeon NZ13-N]RIB35671.1 MAG: hypothetical protein BXU00_01050 [Candidatus Nanoclepta minutus]